MTRPFPAGACLDFLASTLARMEAHSGGDDECLNAMMNVLLDETARAVGTMLAHSTMPQQARDEFMQRLDDAITAPGR